MELQEMKTFLKQKWQTVALFMMVFAVLAFVFSVVQPQKYRSEQRFLVVSKYAEDVDPYAATRSTEYLANLLSEVVYSQNFLSQVMASGYALEQDIFPEDAKKRKKAWNKSLRTRVLGDTGILEITLYHRDRFVTEQLALAVRDVLRAEHAQYHSRGDSTTIQVIDQPITSLRPVQPNILLNTAAGFVLGILAGLAFIYLFPSREFSLIGGEDVSTFVHGLSDDDWSAPVATPNLVEPSFASPEPAPVMASGSVYEPSEMKTPSFISDTEEPEIGYQADPPSNLPIA